MPWSVSFTLTRSISGLKQALAPAGAIKKDFLTRLIEHFGHLTDRRMTVLVTV